MFEGMTAEELWGVAAGWAVLSAIVAWIADTRGRKAGEWFLLSLLFSPLIGFVAVVLMPNLRHQQAAAHPSAAAAAPAGAQATSTFCGQCGTPRTGERFCGKCGNDFWRSAEKATQPLSSSSAPPVRGGHSDLSPMAKALMVLVGIGAVVALLLATGVLSASPAARSPSVSTSRADIPPPGDVWFGATFDPETLEVAGRTDTVKATESFVMVVHLERVMDASDLIVRANWEGSLVSSAPPNFSGRSDLFGFNLGPLFQSGTWRFEVTDVGGNVLAWNSLEVTED